MQQSHAPLPPLDPPISSHSTVEEAPPKLVAQAMDRLARAARVIADIRIGADRLLEALFTSAGNPHQSNKMADLIVKEEANMEQHFQDLRALGRQLEDSGVLTGSLKSRGNSWGLHMPLVCPDGAVVAYAWKRQLAGQAGASAVDRTRLALKAFTDQKKRFFPHLEDEDLGHVRDGELGVSKKLCRAPGLTVNTRELKEEKSLADILKTVEHEIPHLKISTYQRRDWSKRASFLSLINEVSKESSKDQSLSQLNKLRSGSVNTSSANQTAVMELLITSVFRAVLSLHPAGSLNPDAIAFFATDEGGSYIFPRGQSIHHVFRHVTDHANRALQYFSSLENNMSLYLLLHWIASHHTLFSKPCSKCGHLLSMDKSLAILLPPVNRVYRETSSNKISDSSPVKSMPPDFSIAYHIGCSVVGD